MKKDKQEKIRDKKLWSFSTTLRHPDRVVDFLTALETFDGKDWNNETQKNFQINLIRYRFYGFGNQQFYNGLLKEQLEKLQNIEYKLSFEEAKNIFETKNYKDAAMRGRTSFKPLEKMGIAFIVDKKLQISKLKEYILSSHYNTEELFLKSFLKWQYPNPTSRDFSNKKVYNIKPFIATLHLINEVNKICEEKNMKVKGISREEYMIFVHSLLHYKNISKQAKSLIDFRLKLESLKSNKEKNSYIENYKIEFFKEFANATDGNLKDYADNSIRYFRLTRYLTVRGGGFYIDLEPRRMIEIKKLLETDNAEAKEFKKDKYIIYMSDINQPNLPWEEKSELLNIYETTLEDIRILENKLSINKKEFLALKEDILSLKFEIERLREYRLYLQNIELKQKLQDISQIDDVVNRLNNIRNQDLKPSIALEKYITHALNIINDAKNIKPNSILSDDSDFIFTAPANKADIECYYEKFNSICEVTMLVNRDQWHNEGQPVMRHFRDFENTSTLENNYCIFVAPSIHRDTINTFWFSIKYEYEGKSQKIIPLTISQIIEILEMIKDLKQKNRFFSHIEFKKLLDDILDMKNSANSSDEWLNTIPTTINNFKKYCLCN